MQIQSHNHSMQARYACGCGHTSSSGVSSSDTGVYFHVDLLFMLLTQGQFFGIGSGEVNRRSMESTQALCVGLERRSLKLVKINNII